MHHGIYEPAKIEVARSNSFGDAFTRKYIFLTFDLGGCKKCCPLPSTSCDLCTCKVATSKGLEDAFTRNTYFDLGVNVTRNVAQYPLHYVNYAPVKFEVATPKG